MDLIAPRARSVRLGLSLVPNSITLTVPVLSSEEYPGSAYYIFDIDLQKVFGKKGRVPVLITIDGHAFRSSIAKYAGYPPMMVFNKQMRAATGYDVGDTVTLRLDHDLEPRKAEIPEDVDNALKAAGLRDMLDRLSYTHQKEYMDWIMDAKKPETRQRRIARMLDELQKSNAKPR